MNLDNLIEIAAKARASDFIQQIEKGEITYEAVIAELRGRTP